MKTLKRMLGILLASISIALGMPSKALAQASQPSPDKSVWVTPYCGVYHTDRAATTDTRLDARGQPKRLNETPHCLGLRAELRTKKDWVSGVFLNDFNNSSYRNTTLLGVFTERTLLGKRDKGATCGAGFMLAGQIRKGYDLPALGDVYGFCKTKSLYAKALFMPSKPHAFIWSVDVKLFKFR